MSDLSQQVEDSPSVFPKLAELNDALPDDDHHHQTPPYHDGDGDGDVNVKMDSLTKTNVDPHDDTGSGGEDGGIESSPEPHGECYDDSSLFVGDVARTLTEEQLKDIFSPFGEVANVEIKRDKITKISLGYAFVQFKTRQEAAAAKKNLHKTTMASRPIRIGWAQKNTNLFVGDLDPSVTSEMLRDAFRVFGDITEDETFAKSQNYGFVKYRRRIDAETAKREMDGRVLGGRRIRTGWGDANTQRHCVHIQFDPSSPTTSDSHPPSTSSGGVLSDADLCTAFSLFGSVLNIHLPRTSSRLRGFGFVRYNDTDEGEESAEAAITSLHNTRVAGVLVSCNFGKRQHSKHRTSIPCPSTPPALLPAHSDASLNDCVHASASDHPPLSPEDTGRHLCSHGNTSISPDSNGNDDNIPKTTTTDHKFADHAKHSIQQNCNGHQRADAKSRSRPARRKQHSYHQPSSLPQKQPHLPPAQWTPQINYHMFNNSPRSPQPDYLHSPQSPYQHPPQPQYLSQYPQHLHQHAPQHLPHLSPHQHARSLSRDAYANENQVQYQSIIDNAHNQTHLVPPQPLSPMYHGTWISAQGWVPYMAPQYYSPVTPAFEDMQDNLNLNSNSPYHMAQNPSTHPPAYVYAYSNSMNPINTVNPMNQAFLQSSSYTYSSHGT